MCSDCFLFISCQGQIHIPLSSVFSIHFCFFPVCNVARITGFDATQLGSLCFDVEFWAPPN